MWRFISGLVVPDVSKDYIIFVFKGKNPSQTEDKKKTLQNSSTLLPTAHTLTFKKTFCYFCTSSSSFSSCHFLSFINKFYYLNTFCTFVILYSLSFSLIPSLLDSYPSFWLKRKWSIFTIAFMLLAVEKESSDSLPLDKKIYFAEYQTPFQLGYNDQNMKLVVPSSTSWQLSYISAPSYVFVALYLINYKRFLT